MLPLQQYIAEELAEEERRENILQFNIERHLMRSDNDPFTLSNTHFKNLYRLSKDMVNHLILRLAPYMVHSLHGRAVEPSLRIFATLFFYATGSYQRVVGQNYHLSVAQNTVCKCINEITALIVEHLANEWIKFPETNLEKQNIKYIYMDKTRFPGVIGAIDGTHVAILKPVEEEHNYLNRKGYHSKNVQIICDYNLKILNVNARYEGATHDAYIWRHSAVQQIMEQNYNAGDTRSWLLGDSGERMLRYCPEKAGQIIIACATLHNICTEGRLELVEDIVAENAMNVVELQVLPEGQGQEARRNLIAQYFN
ncbi:hypothetical protein MML48_2g00001552 [Holotrichia oblita]|uniref:Uncharacterized protein n=1 Tax=Holotrichia oblita TaxID=644536 RepID=A0ACB9TMA3_HOLOL|nr:hypothetical protein MML48_2g00001552 [Holotrichia oblita]